MIQKSYDRLASAKGAAATRRPQMIPNVLKTPIKFHACRRPDLTFHFFVVPRHPDACLQFLSHFLVLLPSFWKPLSEAWCRQWSFYRRSAFF